MVEGRQKQSLFSVLWSISPVAESFSEFTGP